MKYDFDKVWDRVDTDSIKWDRQFKFGVPTGLIPFWIADTDFGTLPEAVTAIQKRLEHPLHGPYIRHTPRSDDLDVRSQSLDAQPAVRLRQTCSGESGL